MPADPGAPAASTAKYHHYRQEAADPAQAVVADWYKSPDLPTTARHSDRRAAAVVFAADNIAAAAHTRWYSFVHTAVGTAADSSY